MLSPKQALLLKLEQMLLNRPADLLMPSTTKIYTCLEDISANPAVKQTCKVITKPTNKAFPKNQVQLRICQANMPSCSPATAQVLSEQGVQLTGVGRQL